MGTITPIKSNKPTIEERRTRISERWQKSIEGIIETGRELIEQKRDTDHGEWIKIFEDNKPFSRETAHKLIAIAEHPVLSNVAHVQHLPQPWSTLYELSQMPEQLLLRLIQESKVHPELKRSEVRTLKSDEQKRKEDAETLLDILLANCHNARELSLADCGGTAYDCSILKGNISQELIDIVQEVIDTWTSLRNHLLSLK
jgi:hypothetical protein